MKISPANRFYVIASKWIMSIRFCSNPLVAIAVAKRSGSLSAS